MTAHHNREPDEVLVHCQQCNGYLYSISIGEAMESRRAYDAKSGTMLVGCPKMKAGKCAYGSQT